MSLPGALSFARYAYPPNQLGYCGPDGAAALLRADGEQEIARRARLFEGAWSYLEFIARAAGHADPLDEAVVQAYWVGNDLLDRVVPAELVDFLRTRFAGQAGGTWNDAGSRAIAHHSFHVFEVYPWAAMLRRTGNPAAVSVLEKCRIRTGVVCDVHGETARVSSRPLILDGGVLTPGPVRHESVTWSAGGHTLLSGLTPGDRVTLHWDWICDVVTEEQCARLEACEQRQLGFVAGRR
ncbi:DUF6390 family protein [Couchioplanes caeruleus]|uniref:Uncharacterized protein n=2 Tax=Couchioplanes caeruleus TaxID=56438 RepID=A0A1K0GPE4_9ACTN|nr:DUF6390 family protein [Couchioplanes caeruleus]OJF11099.1 hypothetical protein BG844_28575 [Couchioplanes caeruleus subsp. caeruleus]ROP33728.1 hypothetical protein EDD30_6764 [Couchioplanes caeruleus]